MKLRCNFCPSGTKKTDELKLRTINGRDYLLCKLCDRWNHNYDEGGADNEESGIANFIGAIENK